MLIARCLAILILLSAWSCAKHRDARDYEEVDVKTFVTPGISRSVLVSRFGAAELETTAADGTVVLIFHRPTIYVNGKEHLADKEGFTGFKVYLRDDKVLSWDAITSGATHLRP
jgi:hypothetical protein